MIIWSLIFWLWTIWCQKAAYNTIDWYSTLFLFKSRIRVLIHVHYIQLAKDRCICYLEYLDSDKCFELISRYKRPRSCYRWSQIWRKILNKELVNIQEMFPRDQRNQGPRNHSPAPGETGTSRALSTHRKRGRRMSRMYKVSVGQGYWYITQKMEVLSLIRNEIS